jgi:hypothetical protein
MYVSSVSAGVEVLRGAVQLNLLSSRSSKPGLQVRVSTLQLSDDDVVVHLIPICLLIRRKLGSVCASSCGAPYAGAIPYNGLLPVSWLPLYINYSFSVCTRDAAGLDGSAAAASGKTAAQQEPIPTKLEEPPVKCTKVGPKLLGEPAEKKPELTTFELHAVGPTDHHESPPLPVAVRCFK